MDRYEYDRCKLDPCVSLKVFPSEVAAPAGYYQQNMPAPPRQGSPGQPIQPMQPVQQVLMEPAQTSSARKRTAAIPIKSPEVEVSFEIRL